MQSADECLINPFLDEYAVGADAGLTGITEFADHGSLHGCLEIGIVENDKRCITAEFHRRPFHRAGTLLHEQFSDSRRAGKSKLAHLGVASQFGANFLSHAA